MKYVIHHRHPMTPGQLTLKPFDEIFKNQHGKLDTEEGESNEEEEEFTTSEELTKVEYSRKDVNVDETQHQENSHTPETLQMVIIHTTQQCMINIIYYMKNINTSENDNIVEIETIEQYGEKIHETAESIPRETSQVHTVFNTSITS